MTQAMMCDGCGYASTKSDEFMATAVGRAQIYSPDRMVYDSSGGGLREYGEFCSIACALDFVRVKLEAVGLPLRQRKP